MAVVALVIIFILIDGAPSSDRLRPSFDVRRGGDIRKEQEQ